MHVICLPKRLPATSELVALNKRLRDSEVSLDWSDVEANVEPGQLETLFAGLHLSEHIDLIGAETVPEAIMPALLAAFEAVERQPAEVTATADSIADQQYNHSATTPALWLPEQEPMITPQKDLEDVEEELVMVQENRSQTAHPVQTV